MMLLPPQHDVLARELLSSGFSCVLQMPTGSGKTWLAEQAIASSLSEGARAIYLTPLRAIAEEWTSRWGARFGSDRVGIFTGDYGTRRAYPVPFSKAALLVMTPERLDACTRSWRSHWGWIPEVDLVVVDELHLLGDSGRGARLEGTLSRFRRLNPFARVVGLSATLGNRTELAEWLEGVEYVSTWRPIPIEWRVVRFRTAAEKPALLLREVQQNVRKGGKSLIFVQSRRRAEELSQSLSAHGIRASHHHAGLDREQRRTVEAQYREGAVDALVATATLEMGLNLPVRQVILYDLQGFDGAEFRPLTTNSVWQRVGRAGRPGLDTCGDAVLIAPTWDRNAGEYERGRFEAIESGLRSTRHVAEQIVVEVASGLCRTATQVQSALRQSLAAHQRTLPRLDPILQEMVSAGMLREVCNAEEKDRQQVLRATRSGRIATRHLLSPRTILSFRRVLDHGEALTFFDLLLTAATTEDCEPVLPVDFEELDTLSALASRERSHILQLTPSEVPEMLGVDGRRLLSSIKMALLIRAWTRVPEAESIAERFGCYPFEVVRLQESVERLLLAMVEVGRALRDELEGSVTVDPESVPLEERVRALHTMVAGGLDEAAVTLTLIPGLGPALARCLVAVGIADLEDLALADPEDVAKVRGISILRASQWVEDAATRVHSRSAVSYREHGPPGSIRTSSGPVSIDPYRLRRALELAVTPVEPALFRIEGGLEPHLIRRAGAGYICDCLDAARGHACKHQLALRLHEGDPELSQLTGRLASSEDESLNLFQLWFGAAVPNRRLA